ncbi:MAG TPA: hypothetical protein VGR03_15550 [Candidatus Acidoferrum sp.]|nr:hypothetical protein [Candidatus Acidoferrum sp.]
MRELDIVEVNGRIGTIVDLAALVPGRPQRALVEFPYFQFEDFAIEQLKVIFTARAEQFSPAN